MTQLSENFVAPQKPKNLALARFIEVAGDVLARPSGVIGVVLVLAHVIIAVISPWIAPFDYKSMDPMQMLQGPSATHWLGADHLGRDVFSRVLQGGRQAIGVTFVATIFAMLWGVFTGAFLALVGGRVDEFLMRIVDAFLSLPWILKMLVIIVTFGSSEPVLIAALAFFYGIPVIRISRAAAMEVVARDYVWAARARGHRKAAILWREVMPNIFDVLMVEAAMRWSWMLLAFSALSFLGFGVSPPTPDWGLMISDGRPYMSLSPVGVLAPVIALSTLIIGINLTADALAKAFGIDRANKNPN